MAVQSTGDMAEQWGAAGANAAVEGGGGGAWEPVDAHEDAHVEEAEAGAGAGAGAGAAAVNSYELLMSRVPAVVRVDDDALRLDLVDAGYEESLPIVRVWGTRLVLLTHVQAVLEVHRGRVGLRATRDLIKRPASETFWVRPKPNREDVRCRAWITVYNKKAYGGDRQTVAVPLPASMVEAWPALSKLSAFWKTAEQREYQQAVVALRIVRGPAGAARAGALGSDALALAAAPARSLTWALRALEREFYGDLLLGEDEGGGEGVELSSDSEDDDEGAAAQAKAGAKAAHGGGGELPGVVAGDAREWLWLRPDKDMSAGPWSLACLVRAKGVCVLFEEAAPAEGRALRRRAAGAVEEPKGFREVTKLALEAAETATAAALAGHVARASGLYVHRSFLAGEAGAKRAKPTEELEEELAGLLERKGLQLPRFV